MADNYSYVLQLIISICLAAFVANTANGRELITDGISLREWLTQITDNHPSIHAAQAEIDAAAARKRGAEKPLYNPSLQLEAERASSDVAFVGLSQTIDWSDKRSVRIALSEAERQVSLAKLTDAHHSLASTLLIALARYHSALAAMRMADKRLASTRQFFQVAESQFQAGDIGRADRDMAQLSLSEAQIGRASAQTAVLEAEQALAAAAGELLPQVPGLASKLPALDDLASHDVEELIDRHSQIQMLLAQLKVAQNTVHVAVRERREDPAVGVRVGREESETLFGASLSIPLMVRNTHRADIEAANALVLAAEQELALARQKLRSQLAAAQIRYKLTFDTYTQWNSQGQGLLADQLTLAERLWKAGELSTTEFLVRLRETLDAETQAAELHSKAWSAWFEWLDASGLVFEWLKD